MKIEINALLGDVLTRPLNSKAASLYVIFESIFDQPDESITRDMTLLYEIAPGASRHNNENKDGWNEIKDCLPIEFGRGPIGAGIPGGQLLQQVEKLMPVLQKIPYDPEDEIFLVSWDHGSGFGIFREQATGDLPDATIRQPIDHQIDRYPYLERFWKRALQEEAVSTLVARKAGEKPELVLQLGHNVQTIQGEDPNTSFFVNFIKEQECLDLFRGQKDKEGRNWLVFDQENYAVKQSVLSTEQQQLLKDQLDSGVVPKIELDEGIVPEILKNHELAQVLENWLGDKKVGVLLMMNCWMMNLHTLYSMRNCVKYLVAPQGNIDNPGYNYHDILSSIYNNGSTMLTPVQLATNAVVFSHNEFFWKRAARLNPDFPETIDYRTIINIRLDYPESPSPFDLLLAEFHHLIDRLNQLLEDGQNSQDDTLLHLLRTIRGLSFDFTDTGAPMIDLPNYLAFLIAATDGVSVTLLADGFDTEVSNLLSWAQKDLPVIPLRFVGKNCYYIDHKPIYSKLMGLDPTGYSIFFPTDRSISPKVLDNLRDDQLLKEFMGNWSKFVKTVFNKDIT